MVIAESHHGGGYYKIFVKETRDGITKSLLNHELPGRGSARTLPLYVGYKSKANAFSSSTDFTLGKTSGITDDLMQLFKTFFVLPNF